LKEAYGPFKDEMTFEDFKTKVDALDIKKWHFVRASFLYQQALKCQECNPNVAMLLLCSCAETMQLLEGGKPRKNFMKFYEDYCPNNLRKPPIQYYSNLKPPLNLIDASFNEALDYIYAKFRCLYVHEGVGHLELPPKDFHLVGDQLLDKFKDKIYVIDKLAILCWFVSITKECLSKILNSF
jgi:hypothetical protein